MNPAEREQYDRVAGGILPRLSNVRISTYRCFLTLVEVSESLILGNYLRAPQDHLTNIIPETPEM